MLQCLKGHKGPKLGHKEQVGITGAAIAKTVHHLLALYMLAEEASICGSIGTSSTCIQDPTSHLIEDARGMAWHQVAQQLADPVV